MYGMEALWFNIKDGYLGEAPWTRLCLYRAPLGLDSVAERWHASKHNAGVLQFNKPLLTLAQMQVPRHGTQACVPCCAPADAVVRGHRSGLLSTADYNNLCQCESLDDIKLNLVRDLVLSEVL